MTIGKTPSPEQMGAFRKYFRMGLNQYWDVFFGFDVIGFDRAINTPDGVSTADYCTTEYGPSAAQLIRDLLE